MLCSVPMKTKAIALISQKFLLNSLLDKTIVSNVCSSQFELHLDVCVCMSVSVRMHTHVCM